MNSFYCLQTLINEIELLRDTNEQLQAVNLDEGNQRSKIEYITLQVYLDNGEIHSKDQLTGSLEDLNFFNLPVDVR